MSTLDAPVHHLITVIASADVDVGRFAEARALVRRHRALLESVIEPQYRLPYLRELLRIAWTHARLGDADRHARAIARLGRVIARFPRVGPPAIP